MTDPAARRILRLALGLALSLWFSQAFGWTLSFIASILTAMLLGLPLPPPKLKGGIVFVMALVLPVVLAMGLLPFMTWMRPVAVILAVLALFYTFYYTAKGGKPVVGTLMTVGLAVVLSIGSVSLDLMPELVAGLARGAIIGILFVWIAHAIVPDPPPDRQ